MIRENREAFEFFRHIVGFVDDDYRFCEDSPQSKHPIPDLLFRFRQSTRKREAKIEVKILKGKRIVLTAKQHEHWLGSTCPNCSHTPTHWLVVGSGKGGAKYSLLTHATFVQWASKWTMTLTADKKYVHLETSRSPLVLQQPGHFWLEFWKLMSQGFLSKG